MNIIIVDVTHIKDIEVEDEVTAYLENPNGATGVFITSTGEAPGTNRLEICGEKGKIVAEGGSLSFIRNVISSRKFSKISKERFKKPESWDIKIPVQRKGDQQHLVVLQNFVDAILDKIPLIAPAQEGINSVEMINAILYSSLIGKPIKLPLDGAVYERKLKKLISDSKFKKRTVKRILTKENMDDAF